ncbi:MAG TPA: GspMb/PilO family protein [Candidatus Sumerlaeota bacterium]|nr:MAG: hypothetical protein BWZ08_00528 [candidate division BRC1 bacterium ADurb.BinA292]HOE95007.1 GspMb/PilO family protein [Candidatus Sumerlaeota bacterium]HOR26448.1 GspMb/PilO family protein [Candidatus Sumerlaeota bacterium]HPK00832.1 GspMb/PilO family protein [Candidatus Sumerlaeota bacterium]
MSRIPRTNLLLIVGAVCIAAFLGDRLILTPQLAAWRSRAQRIEQLERDLANGEYLIEREEAIEEQWAEAMDWALPADRAQAEAELLQALNRWAGDAALRLSDLKPRWREDEQLGEQLEVRLNAQGDLEDISRFLYALETSPLSLRVEGVELRARDDRGREITLDLRISGLTRSAEPRPEAAS